MIKPTYENVNSAQFWEFDSSSSPVLCFIVSTKKHNGDEFSECEIYLIGGFCRLRLRF